jgi:hypothetical protein
MNKYPNSGKLNYSKNKVNEKSPDFYGEVVFERQLLRKLLDETDQDDIPVKLSGWNMEGNYGPWIRVSVNTWKKEESGGVNTPAPPKSPPVEDEDLPF